MSQNRKQDNNKNPFQALSNWINDIKMGCTPSKEKGGVSGLMGQASSTMGQAMKQMGTRTSIVDQMVMAKTFVTQQVPQKAREINKIIFATPLQDVENFQAPHYEKTKKERDFIEKAILQNFVFSQMRASELMTMIGAFEKCAFEKNDKIITQGEEGDYFYVIEKGHVRFQVNGKSVGEPAGPGDTFGELALLYNAPRAATCIALDDTCILYRVDQTTFRYILQSQTQNADKVKRALVKNIPFLKDLDEADLNKLVDTLTPRPFRAGEYVVKKGDEGDAFYVIQEGKIMVRDIEVGGQKYEDNELGPGDYFGERALVTKEPRAANCVAATNGIALVVDSDTFTKVMGNLSQLVLKSSDKRALESIQILQRSGLSSGDYSQLAELIVDDNYTGGRVLFKEHAQTPAVLYFVRGGEVKLTSSDAAYNDKIIKQGGYFGDDMLRHDAKQGNMNGAAVTMSAYTATILTECTLGMLTLEECRSVFDTTKVGKSKPSMRASIREADIDINALEYHTILGAGTFGQVWLVSRSSSDGTRKPYALKIQSKYELIRHSQAKGVVQEKNIMAQLHHPFIIKLVTTSQDKQRVYMLLGIVQGGELFNLMHNNNKDGLSDLNAKFYAAGILEGLGYMHRRHILYRDLKPENVLIDESGYPVIVDLGFAKVVREKTYTLCGTPLYLAPEVILNRGHDKGADHWSLGVMIYEMLCGLTPFYKDGMDQIALFRAIVKGDFKFPRGKRVNFTDQSKDLIQRLLVVSPTQRLGSLAKGEKDIYRVSWFQDINFEKLKRKEIPAPWIPKVKDPLDTSNFENWDHLDDKRKSKDPPIAKKDDDIFKDF